MVEKNKNIDNNSNQPEDKEFDIEEIMEEVDNYEDKEKAEITGNARFGNLYGKFFVQIDSIMKMYEPSPIALLWMQGERDAREELGEVYEDQLKKLYKQLCQDLGRKNINFVIGRLSDFDMKNERYHIYLLDR